MAGTPAEGAGDGSAGAQGEGELDARAIPGSYRDVFKAYFAR
jgi:hypothetical protein